MVSAVYCLLFTCLFYSTKSVQEFLSLDYSTENHGVYGQMALVKCIGKSNQERKPTIYHVTWKKGGEKLLMFSDGNLTHQKDGFQFADPAWKETMNVSLLLTNTKMSDMGEYECMVFTDIGYQTVKMNLSVTAKYQTPTMNSIPEIIQENMDVTLFCNATGGDQIGSVHWFDEFGTNWTKSSVLTSSKNENGLFNLSSSLKVLMASSSVTYNCLVFNARGAQEGKANHSLLFQELRVQKPDHPTADTHTRYVAPLVIIGSLIVGLLIAVLVCRRRSKSSEHRPVKTDESLDP